MFISSLRSSLYHCYIIVFCSLRSSLQHYLPPAASSELSHHLFAPYKPHLDTIYLQQHPVFHLHLYFLLTSSFKHYLWTDGSIPPKCNLLYFSAVFVIACWMSFHWISNKNTKLFGFINCVLFLYLLQWKFLHLSKSFIKIITRQCTLILL